MAMTKAERAALDALRTRAALAWPPPPPPRVVVSSVAFNDYRELWTFRLSYYAHDRSRAVKGFVSPFRHTTVDEDVTLEEAQKRYSWSRDAGGPWYVTKLDALRAMHHAAAMRCAEQLAQIERQIEAEANG